MKKSLLLNYVFLAVMLVGSFSHTRAWAQEFSIAGRVTSDTGEGIPGVNVVLKGATIGTVTDADGRYKFSLPDGSGILIFSFIGFLTEEVPINNQSTIDVRLTVDLITLGEVVVVGYGTQKRAEVTAAIATVKAEDFNAGGVRSPLDLIQGKVAGLSITRIDGNNPNSSAAVQLRGVTTIASGGSSPLIVIDGIPGGSLDLLQQDDIESFDVLKDGSAAAIYGTRGNNGVILITTKRGKSGEARFDYSTYVQREIIAKRPEVLSAQEYIDAAGAANDLGDDVDVYDMLLNKENLSQYHNLSMTAGTNNTNYRASVYYNDANGIAIKNAREQFGVRLNLNQTGLNDRLDVRFNVASNFNKANLLGGIGSDFGQAIRSDFEQAIQRNPTAPLFNPDGTYLQTTGFNNYNPISRINQELSERDQQTFSGDLKIALEVLKGLKISGFGAIIRDTWNDRAYRERASRSSQQSYSGTGFASKSNALNLNKLFESTVDYTTTISNDHIINAIAGYSYQYNTSESFGVNNSGFITDAFQDWNLGAGNAITNTLLPRPGISSFKDDNTLIAFFGRVSYSYKNKYQAQFILRHEGSSRFGVNYKWGNFPAVSVGWNLSEERFLEDLALVNNLKLRVGYGVTGNQNIGNYNSLITLGTGGQYLQEGVWVQTYGLARNPNPDLRWEKKSEINIGLDFSLIENKVSGAIDVYNRRTVDLLGNYTTQLPPFVRETLYTNVGTISNKGIEVLLNANLIRNKDFSWDVTATWNSHRNKMTSISNDIYKLDRLEFGNLPSPGALGAAIRTVEGGALGNFYGKRFAGFTEDGKWLFYKADGTAVQPANINENDLTIIGNGVPKYMASLSNTLRYKRFDFTVFFRGKFAYDILNTQQLYFGNKSWLPNNVLKTAITKNAQLNDAPQFSDYYLERGDFVKLDNVTLGYTFKPNAPYIRNLRIYATVRNLVTMTGYSGLDPELQDTGFTTGIDNRGFYPRTTSFTAGLNVGF
jgi:TonB-linked SusC/RagA family outer membrane protein